MTGILRAVPGILALLNAAAISRRLECRPTPR